MVGCSAGGFRSTRGSLGHLDFRKAECGVLVALILGSSQAYCVGCIGGSLALCLLLSVVSGSLWYHICQQGEGEVEVFSPSLPLPSKGSLPAGLWAPLGGSPCHGCRSCWAAQFHGRSVGGPWKHLLFVPLAILLFLSLGAAPTPPTPLKDCCPSP